MEPSTEHRLLVELLRSRFVDLLWTTNFDHLLEDACADLGLPVASVDPIGWEACRLLTLDRVPVVHLHGRDGLPGPEALGPTQRGMVHEMVRGATATRDLIVLGWSGACDPLVDLLPRGLAPCARAWRVDLRHGVPLQDWLAALHELLLVESVSVADPVGAESSPQRVEEPELEPSIAVPVPRFALAGGPVPSVAEITVSDRGPGSFEVSAPVSSGGDVVIVDPESVANEPLAEARSIRVGREAPVVSFAEASCFDDDCSDLARFPSPPESVVPGAPETLTECDESLALDPGDLEARGIRARLRFEKALATDDEIERSRWIDRAEQDWAALPPTRDRVLEEVERRREWILYEQDPDHITSSLDRCLALLRPLAIANPRDIELGLQRQRVGFELAHWVEDDSGRDRALSEAFRVLERAESGAAGRDLERIEGHAHVLVDGARDATSRALRHDLLRGAAERLGLIARFRPGSGSAIRAAECWRSLTLLARDPEERRESLRASEQALHLVADSGLVDLREPCRRALQRLRDDLALIGSEGWPLDPSDTRKPTRWSRQVARSFGKRPESAGLDPLLVRARLRRIEAAWSVDDEQVHELLYDAHRCIESLPRALHHEPEVEEERARILFAFAWILDSDPDRIVALRAAERSLHGVVQKWSEDAEIWYALASISGRRGQVIECVERTTSWLRCACCFGIRGFDRIRDDASFDPVRRAPEFVRAVRGEI